MINSEEGRAPQWRPLWPRGLCAIFIRCRGFLITHEKDFDSWRQFSSNLVTIVDAHLRAGRRSSPCEAMNVRKSLRRCENERCAGCLAELLHRANKHRLARVNVFA